MSATETRRSLVWLASYPKSGNTWVRAFLAHYLRLSLLGADEPLFESMHAIPVASSRDWFDLLGLPSLCMRPDEIDFYRPEVYRALSAVSAETRFLKVHDAYRGLPGGQPLFPADVSLGAVYIVRNPLDVAVSFAYHRNASIDIVIQLMNNPATRLERPALQLDEHLDTWSRHVTGWVDQSEMPVHVVRYEDMSANPSDAFSGMLRFCGVEIDELRLHASLEATSFEQLQAQERLTGFQEKPPRMQAFFRRGQVSAWQDEMSPAQEHALVEAHQGVMRRFGYLE